MSAGNLGNEHPFLDINLIKEQLSLEEIQGKLKDITTKLIMASRTGNAPMINQLNMIKETYQRAQHEMLDDMFGSGATKNYDGKIDIS